MGKVKTKKQEIVKQQEYYVAYIDLLGYKDFFEKHRDETEEFLTTVEDAVDEVVRRIDEINPGSTNVIFEPCVKVFSDNILIAVQLGKQTEIKFMRYMQLVDLVNEIQLKFIIKYKLAFRGAIAKGLFYVNDKLVFGEALIKAYEMEQAAVYPKIILERAEIDETRDYINTNGRGEVFVEIFADFLARSVAMDGDGTYFINYLPAYQDDVMASQNVFSFIPDEKAQEQLLKHDNYHHWNYSLEKHRDVLIEKIEEYGHYNDIIQEGKWEQRTVDIRKSVLLKYMWIVDYHNAACKLSGFKDYVISYLISTDPTTHQPTVKVISD